MELRFCCGCSEFLNVSLLLPGTNDQERLLIHYCWIFNHPINLTCDKGSLAALGKNITACNLHHISFINGMREYVERRRGGEMGGEEEDDEDKEEEGMFNLLIQFL